MNQLYQHSRPFILFALFATLFLSTTQFALAEVPWQSSGTERTVAGKTFVYRNNIWIDTAFDAAKHPLYRIGIHSSDYTALAASLPQIESYRHLGDRLLVLHEGWGIEINDSATSGPFVPDDRRRPDFLINYRADVDPPHRIASGLDSAVPSLLAASAQPSGVYISIHISWNEIAALLTLVGLVAAVVWLIRRREHSPLESQQ